MITLLAQIAPQRSTQYTALARDLALPELQLSPFRPQITGSELVTLGGQAYLHCAVQQEPAATRLHELGMNELFTHFLCNLARFSSAFADQPWSNLHRRQAPALLGAWRLSPFSIDHFSL